MCARGGANAEIVGGIDFHRGDDGAHELGYWLTPAVWGRGYATEAGHAVIAMARHALGYRRLPAWHFVDNPASARVLAKLGFRPTGRTAPSSEEHTSALPSLMHISYTDF